MPKQKTHKGTKKRFRLSAKGKVKHRPAGTSHLATRKNQKRIRKLRGTETLGPRHGQSDQEGPGRQQLLSQISPTGR